MAIGRLVALPFKALADLGKLVVTYAPGGLGFRLRNGYYRKRLKHCGANVCIDIGVIIDGPEFVSIGDNVHIDRYVMIATGAKMIGKVRQKQNARFTHAPGEVVIGSDIHIAPYCQISGYGGVFIGDNCGLSAAVKLYSLSNTPNDPDDPAKVISIMPLEQAPFVAAPIVLERNVWLALHVVVMPGATIGENSFVVSNSVVAGQFAANSYIAGQPAKRLKERFATGQES
jgi:acetyltransferase-like isoleucine patch superfamily enzyme